MEATLARLEAVTTRLEQLAASGGASAGGAGGAAAPTGDGDSPAVLAFDDFISGTVDPAIASAKALGNADLSKQMDAVKATFQAQRSFLALASKAKKPMQPTLIKLLKPTTDAMAGIEAAVARGDFYNHMKAVADGLACLGWVTVEPAPAPFINEMVASFLFYGNKVLREYKEKDTKHVDFVNNFRGVIEGLSAYVKQHHTTGVAWNPKGKDASEVTVAAPAPAAAPAAGGAPPPPPPGAAPPPPPPSALMDSTPSSAAPKSDTGALFSAINNLGSGITSGLKKVTDDMKTHKNPNLRAGGSVTAAEAPAKAAPAATSARSAAPAGEPKCELRGKVWWIENQRGNKALALADLEQKQSVFISNCVDCVVQISGKCNQIAIDKCEKTGVVFESVVASVEVINSKRMQVQCTGVMHTLMLDKVHEIQIYLSKESLGVSITSSVSSDMNVVIPGASDDVDPTEVPIPYQFQTVIKNGKLVTESVRHE